jgi:flagellar biosynthesis/type III secretory pathway chaperone
MNPLDTKQLTDLVAKRLKCASRLRDLAMRQQKLIGDGELGGLLSLLSDKQKLFDALRQVDRQLDPYRAQDPEARHWRCAEDRQVCARAVQCCDQLLSEIRHLEQQCEHMLIQRRDELADTLQGAHVATAARGAYAAHGSFPANPSKSA